MHRSEAQTMLTVGKEWLLSLPLLMVGPAILWGFASSCQGPGSRDCHFLIFALGALVIPLLSMGVSQQGLAQRLLRTLVAAVLMVAAYYLFVSYQDHPWFVQPPAAGCDGPCFGWYTFEFDPPYGSLFIISGLATSFGVLFYFGTQRLAGQCRRRRDS